MLLKKQSDNLALFTEEQLETTHENKFRKKLAVNTFPVAVS